MLYCTFEGSSGLLDVLLHVRRFECIARSSIARLKVLVDC
jgi:hypothetical protein